MNIRPRLRSLAAISAAIGLWIAVILLLPSTPTAAIPLIVSHTSVADFAGGENDGNLVVTELEDGALELARLASPTGWTDAGNDLPAALLHPQATRVDRHLFVVGGFVSATSNPNIYRATLYPNHTPGTWRTLRPLPTPYVPASLAVGANGYLFVEGVDGDLRDVAPQRALFSSRVDAAGNLGPWQTLAPLPPLASNHRASVHDRVAVAADGYLFVLGLTQVEDHWQPAAYSAAIRAEGTLGEWASVTALPIALEGVRLVAHGHALYAIGGRPAGQDVPQGTVYRAPIEADGRPGAWVAISELSQGVVQHAAAVAAGRLVVAGGSLADESNPRTTVLSARIRPDGQLDVWVNLADLPVAMSASPVLLAAQGHLFAAGGQRTFPTLYTLSFRPTDINGTWEHYPYPEGAVGDGDYLFRLGSPAGGQTPAYSRYVPPSGPTATDWVTQTAIPEVITDTSLVVAGGRLFALGQLAHDTSRIYQSPILISGTLGAWSAGMAAPDGDLVGLAASRLVVRADDTLWSTSVGADGSLDAWQLAGQVPAPPPQQGALVHSVGDDLIVHNYYTPFGFSSSSDELVWRATLQPDGSLGAWERLDAPLPRPTSGVWLSANRGFLFSLGGFKSTGAFATPWLSGQGPAEWRLLRSLPGDAPTTGFFNSGQALGNNLFFSVFGPTGGADYRAPLNPAVRRGLFGHQFDLGSEFVINRLSWQRAGTPEAQVRVRYRIAATDGAFGPWSPFTTTNPIDLPGNPVGRHLEYQIEVENPTDDFFAITQVELLRGANFVRVQDEAGQPVSEALVYRNGAPAGQTGSDGRLALADLQAGDTLAALAPQETFATTKGAHQTEAGGPNWAYRIYLTSLAVQPDGQVEAYTVTRPGEQLLTVRRTRPLVLFNLVISTEWNAAQFADAHPEVPFDTYLKQLARAFRSASDFLYDVTDGQMAFGQVTLYTGGRYWEEADVQVLASDQVRPTTAVGGITSRRPYTYTGSAGRSVAFYPGPLRLGRYWTRYSGFQGNWDQPDGFRTLVHEFAHYALYLYDEYFYTDARGQERPAHCTSPDIRTNLDDATNASIMDWHYNASELADSDRWTADCTNTVQGQVHGEPDWATVIGNYRDRQTPARWQFGRPADLGVNRGPEYLPRNVLDLPSIHVEPEEQGGLESLLLEVVNEQGVFVAGKQVQLYLFQQQDGQTVQILDQGAPGFLGNINVLGTRPGDVVKAVTWDGSAFASQEVTGRGRLVLQAARGWNPTVDASPVERGGALKVQVSGLPAITQPVVAQLFQVGGTYSQTAMLTQAGQGMYTGTLRLDEGRPLDRPVKEGHLYIYTVDAGGHPISETVTTFAVGGVGPSGKESHPPLDPASSDGNLRLHIPDTTGLPDDLLVIVMPTRGTPAIPPGLRVVGTPYSLRASGGVDSVPPSSLTMYYHGEAVQGVDESRLRVYWWDEDLRGWQDKGGGVDTDRNLISTVITRLGIYAIMSGDSSAPAGQHKDYLPLIIRIGG